MNNKITIAIALLISLISSAKPLKQNGCTLVAISSKPDFAMAFDILAMSHQAQDIFYRRLTTDSITIKGRLIGNQRFSSVTVQQYSKNLEAITKAPISGEQFTLNLSEPTLPGMYRLVYSLEDNTKYVDIIVTGSERHISFNLNINGGNQTPVFTESDANRAYYDFKKETANLLSKIYAVDYFIGDYPDSNDAVVKMMLKQSTILKGLYTDMRSKFLGKNGNNLIGKLVLNTPVYFSNPLDLAGIQNYYRRLHFWDGIDTNDPTLINTPVYNDLILQYLSYHMNKEMKLDSDEMTQGFIKSTDTVMKKFGVSAETRMYACNYLRHGFSEISQTKVIDYLDQKYGTSCKLSQGSIAGNRTSVNQISPLRIGGKAPEIEYDVDGKPQQLSNLISPITMVVFWASWCPYCMNELPKVNEELRYLDGVKMLAISLDDKKEDYQAAIKSLGNMLHYSDFKKWNGKIVNDYAIMATPTFILLDKDKTVIGIYPDWQSALQKIKLLEKK